MSWERMLRLSGSRAHVLLDLWIASSLDRELSVWSNFQSSSERTYEHKSSPSCHSKWVSWRLFMGGYSNIPLSRFRCSCKSPKSDFLLMGKSESELRKARWNRDPRSAPDTHRQVIHCLHVLSTGRQSYKTNASPGQYCLRRLFRIIKSVFLLRGLSQRQCHATTAPGACARIALCFPSYRSPT